PVAVLAAPAEPVRAGLASWRGGGGGAAGGAGGGGGGRGGGGFFRGGGAGRRPALRPRRGGGGGGRCAAPRGPGASRRPGRGGGRGGHAAGLALGPGGRGLCPTGMRTFISALDKVAVINGISRKRPGWLHAWLHASVARRVEFLEQLLSDQRLEPRFQRRLGL